MSNSWKSFIYLPIVFLILLAGGFFACYGIALSYGHVVSPPLWPYVSDTGATPPESCIFTLLLTWGAFLILLTMVLYYRYVIYHNHNSRCNLAALITGIIACFGMTMVASFQWTAVLVPHLIGAGITFVGAVIYSWMIIYIGWRHMSNDVHSKNIVYCRIIIAVITTVSGVVLVAGFLLARVDSKYYNLATISEWLLIYFSIIYIATMMYELRQINKVKIPIVLHDGIASLHAPNGSTIYHETTLKRT